jgi:hypothetical protein
MAIDYPLTDRQKNLLRSIAPGLQDGTVSPEWTISTGDNRIGMIHGLDRDGSLWREVWRGVKESDFDAFVRCGLFGVAGYSPDGRPVRFNLVVPNIIEAVNNDFEPRIDIRLEPEQQDLLFTLVEAARNVSREKRQKFNVEQYFGDAQPTVYHPGLPGSKVFAHMGDIETLAREGLLALSSTSKGGDFDVTPLGYQFYKQLKHRIGQPVQRMERTMRSYLDTAIFRQKYPDVYRKAL